LCWCWWASLVVKLFLTNTKKNIMFRVRHFWIEIFIKRMPFVRALAMRNIIGTFPGLTFLK
jgi:hypothetical protein